MPKERHSRQVVLPPGFIPTEVFVELNPEIIQFVEQEYLPYKFPQYVTYKNPWPCSPRRFCVPQPCAPV